MSVIYKQEVIAGVPDFQTIYDLIYPVGKTVIEFNAPTVPNGVTAVWEDITSTFEGRSIWFSTSGSGGTEVSGSLPNIYGTISNINNYPNPSGVFTAQSDKSEEPTSVQNSGVKVIFDASKYNDVYTGDATNKVVRPTSVIAKVYKRTS